MVPTFWISLLSGSHPELFRFSSSGLKQKNDEHFDSKRRQKNDMFFKAAQIVMQKKLSFKF
jgi:hypothetical protein